MKRFVVAKDISRMALDHKTGRAKDSSKGKMAMNKEALAHQRHFMVCLTGTAVGKSNFVDSLAT